MAREVYFSLDIETDGQIPIVNSMRQLGMKAFTEDRRMLDRFCVKLHPWPGAKTDPSTLNWWMETAEKRAMWGRITSGELHDPAEAMLENITWIRSVAAKYEGRAVCVASPAGFDFTFWRVYALATWPSLESPFGHRCIDLRSYTMGLYGRPYLESGKETLYPDWSPLFDNSHDALDDADKQGDLFFNLLADGRRLRQFFRRDKAV